MGFKEVKRKFIEALREDNVLHDPRELEDKNFVADQQISLEQAADIVARTKGGEASNSPHHFLPEVEVWVFRPMSEAGRWYVKGYLLEDELHIIELHLISFHPSER